MSTNQKQILDAIETALESVSGVNKVTQDFDAWNKADPQDYSTLYIHGKKPEVERLAYSHPTSDDMRAMMDVIIEGNIYERYESDTAATLDLLMKNVETAIIGSSTLDSLVVDITLSEDEFVSSVADRYGLFSATYVVEYYYNHLSP